MKNVQITEDLFWKLINYHILGNDEDEAEIISAIEEKMNKMVNRQIYTEYKTGATPEQKEKARIEYLNKRGIHKDFRW